MTPKLVGISGPFRGVNLSLTDAELSIGRDAGNTLSVNDPALSRRQCVIIADADSFLIRDLGSRNGTLVNGIPVQQQQLRHGDQICVGESVLAVLIEDAPAHHLEKSPVELCETSPITASPVLLRPEESIYLRTDLARVPFAGAASDLSALLKIAKGIGSIRDREGLQWQLLGAVFDLVPAARGAIVLFNDDDSASATGWDRVHGPGKPVRISRTVLERVRDTRTGMMANDIGEDTMLQAAESLAHARVRSLLCVPIIIAGEVGGAIYLDCIDASQLFTEHHLEMITAVGALAAMAIENVRYCEQLRQENLELRAELGLEHNMVGQSAAMRKVFDFVGRVAPTDSTVLIQGESGTGKELVARAIHGNSPRKNASCVTINCAAITETLLESELFGHEKGAFTGAAAQKKGKIELADGGTLFLDEIGELAPGLQAKLLRVLQEREFERVGGMRPIKLDVRLIAASNRNLLEAVNAGTFRRDLFYRLNVVAITMPPLRERRDDIPQLAEHFIAKASRKCRTRVKALSAEARSCLVAYDWPGNVRELENVVERAMVLGSSERIIIDDLPDSMVESGAALPQDSGQFHGALKETKKQLVMKALQAAHGNYIEAADSLGIHPNSLLRLIRLLDLKAAVKSMTHGGEGAAD